MIHLFSLAFSDHEGMNGQTFYHLVLCAVYLLFHNYVCVFMSVSSL